MKKIKYFFNKISLIYFSIFSLVFVFNLSFFSNINTQHIFFATAYQTEKIVYAKAGENCGIYSSTEIDEKNLLFYVPDTYFISLLSKVNDNLYKVQYSSYTGYAMFDTFSVVSFTPSTPYLEGVTFDISSNVGTQIWSKPSPTRGSILSTISADTKNITYIASATGEIPLGGSSNLWYYAKYTPATNVTALYEGYIYSEATTNLSHIPTNLEAENEDINFENVQNISIDQSVKIVMISLICAPFLILFILAVIKAIKETKKRKEITKFEKLEEEKIQPKSFIKKRKIKPEPKENPNEFEIVFPEYNYIDDDNLL